MNTNNEKVDEYIEKALTLCEEYKTQIWSCAHEFYEAYTKYLAKSGDFEKALTIHEKYYEYLKIKNENENKMLRYLSKTILTPSLFKSKNNELPNIPRGLKLNISQKSVFLAFEDIIYIEVDKHYLFFNKVAGEKVKLNEQLKNITDKLDDRFLQCSRSFIVNMNFIKAISNKKIELNNGIIIPCTKKMIDIQKIYYGWVY
jgi:DNA-binding LytR/AlgR family response regulator